jgi:glutamate/tyrosine decarboxylase-like PLP-dependent enzyme
MGATALHDLPTVMENSRPPSPRFFGYVLGSGEPLAAAADLLASVLNQNVTAWRSAPAAVTIEHTVLRWLAHAVGCPGFFGSLTSGGSAANLMALAMAREAKLPANERGARPGTIYASDEVHMSIPKAVALLGLGRSNLRLIPTDSEFRMRTDELARSIRLDLESGGSPLAVVASAGTVSTGAVDPLREIAAIARHHGLWLHVDGAYGAFAAMAVPERFWGMALADSISLDPHKWLYQPLDCGCLLFRDPATAQAAFSHSGEYARALESDPLKSFAFFEESLELSRRFRALKLWLSMRYHGMAAFRDAIAADLAHAQHLAEAVRRHPELELMAPVGLSAVCFRYRAPNADEINQQILRRVIERGRVYLSNASIRGAFALRACFVNHRTRVEDVDEIIPEVLAAAGELASAT